jgi:ribose transport system substrate-binding protein
MHHTSTRRRTCIAAALSALALSALALSACTAPANSNSSDSGAGSTPATDVAWSPGLMSWHEAPGPFATPPLSGDTYRVGLGNNQTVTWKKGAPLNFIYFLQGTSNTYLQAEADGAQAAAKADGVNLTLVNAQFDASTQRAQIQNALLSGKYNGAAIRAVSSTGACGPLTSDAPKAGVPVIVVVQEICNRDNDSGQALWSPGTLAYVGGGGGTYPFYSQWALDIAKSLTQPTKAALIVGPSELGAVQVTVNVLKKAAAAYPNLQIEAVNYTDFTDAGGLSAAQNILQAHPDVKAIILEYGGQTPSVIRAISEAGRTGTVGVYEAGGDKNAKQELLAGTLKMSAAQFPYTAAYCAIDMLAAVHEGKKVPRVVYNDCNTQAGDPAETVPLILTKDNVAKFTPDY